MSVWVHQQVLVVVGKEVLNKLERCLIDRLDNEATLLGLYVEISTLVLRHTHLDVFEILHRECTLDETFGNILNASDHVEDLRSELSKVECASFVGI